MNRFQMQSYYMRLKRLCIIVEVGTGTVRLKEIICQTAELLVQDERGVVPFNYTDVEAVAMKA